MKPSVIDSKPIKAVYGIVLPIVTVLFLLYFASINIERRTLILGSVLSDFMIRLFITAWFCGLYIRLSRFSTYQMYPGKTWSKENVGVAEKYFLIGLIIFFSTMSGIVTYWAIRWFLPDISNLAVWVAIANNVMIFLSMVTRYWILRI